MTDPKWTPGRVVWRELLTDDVEKAKGFYGELFGWKFQDFPMPDGTYWIAMQGERGLGGLMRAPEGVPPCFMSYVSVEDVDATVAAATAEGGSVRMPPMDMADVGRMAVFADFAGAHLCVMRGAKGDTPAPVPPPVHSFCWETVMTTDVERAKAYYGKLFGWTTQPGPGGQGAVFLAGEAMVADVQEARGMPNCWMTYVVVDKLADTRARAEKLGGKVLMPSIDVPGMGTVAVVADPAGAVLGLFEAAPR